MFLRNLRGMSIALGFSLLVMSGCSTAAAASGEKQTGAGQAVRAASGQIAPASASTKAASDWKQPERPFDYAAMKEDVVIQLNEEPRLQSPLRTVVGAAPQAYTLFFREEMDRGSVEAAIRKHAKEEAAREGLGFIEPAFAFHWASNRQLQVLVTLPEQETKERDWTEYVLSAAGAKSAKGAVVGDSNAFHAVVLPPAQIWRVSVDGKVREKLTDFSVMTSMELLDREQRYVLQSRFTKYCECDARYPMLYSIYDTKTKQRTPYPVELTDNYRGEGVFFADRRGFFYAQPEQGTTVPNSDSVTRVQVQGYVHGASFSHDQKQLLMAVGRADQKKDLDLVVYDLGKGTEKRIDGAIKGWIPTSEFNGEVLPVSFHDDGRYATFAMRSEEAGFVEIRQRYDWKSGKVIDWHPPVPADFWSGYVQSTDGEYQMYWNAGLFKGNVQLMDMRGQGLWLPGTHRYLFTEWEKAAQETDLKQSLYLFDADTKQQSVLVSGLPAGLSLLGASADGKWLYVMTDRTLAF